MSKFIDDKAKPIGPASGDLSGTYPSPIVVKIQTYPVDNRPPANGDTLVYSGGEWIPTPSPSNTATLFKGTWDADANNPSLPSYPPTGVEDGYTWIVIKAGETNVGGITGWKVGDYIVYSSGQWYKLSNSSFGWTLTGNAGTIPNVNYIGTSDVHDLSIRANAQEIIRVLVGGGVNIAGDLTVNGNVIVDNDKQLRINTNGFYTAFQTGLQSGNVIYTLPLSYGANNSFLVTDAGGNLSWKAPITISAGAGLTGGGDISTDRTISMPNVGAPATYGSASVIPVITTDTQGRVSSVTNTSVAIGASQITSGVLPVVRGGTSISSGTSGGVPYFDTTSSMASSALLTKSAITLGGGTGAAPYSLNSLGTTTTVLHGNAAGDPSFGAVSLTADVSGVLPIANGGTNLTSSGASGNILVSNGSAWASVPVTGDISITSGGVTTVNKIQNITFTTTGASNGSIMQYNGTSWAPASITSVLQNSYIAVVAAEDLLAGDAVYVVNSNGQNVTVRKSRSDSLSTVQGTIGVVTTNIPNNGSGFVLTLGTYSGIDTNSFTQGDPVYVSTTVYGGLTKIKPSGPNYAFQMGIVIKGATSSGQIYICPMLVTTTQNIADIALTSVQNYDMLKYDSTTQRWVNGRELHVPNTQTALILNNGDTILAPSFNNIVYLPIKTQGGASITLSNTAIEALANNATQWGRQLWLHNVDNNRSITIPHVNNGNVKLDGGVSLILTPGTIAKFVWTTLGSGGSWHQTDKAITAT